MEELVPIAVVGSFFGAIAYVTRVLSDNRVKRELISMKADREIIDHLMLQLPAQNMDANLKWGLVTVALGLAFVLIQFLGLDGESPLTYGLLFISGGAGLLGFYALKKDSTPN